jgi:DUF1680 family protein
VHLFLFPGILILLIYLERQNIYMRKYLFCHLPFLIFPLLLAAQRGVPDAALQVKDRLIPAAYAGVALEGRIGQLVDSCIRNGVMAVDYGLYAIPFRDKTDRGGGFRGEFWGKWFTSAVLACAYQPEEEYREILDKSFREIMQTREPDGRISSYPREETFLNWDIWGRKYVLLGLLAYFDLTGDPSALDAARSATDELISIAGPGKQKLTETGLKALGSMSSTSILEPVAGVYLRTGDKQYLDFANYLVSLWSEPNAYTESGMRLVEDALLGVPPVKISAPKAYEVMSCYEGLCELYRATGESRYLNVAVRFAEGLIDREIMIVGSGSSAELWCDGAFRQTGLLEQPMETCVTATWIKFCYQLLRLTGDAKWADQMEITLYNALSGAMYRSGHWWAYFSPLAGERMPSPMQIPQCQSSCCVANGPRGLLTTPGWSVMSAAEGPVINVYTAGKWDLETPGGKALNLVQKTSYPFDEQIEITIRQKETEKYTISLRIPAWSKKNKIRINSETITYPPGAYARITREWRDGDRIRLDLDLRGRLVRAPGNVNDLAVMRGPIVLALDSRLVGQADYNLWLYPENTQWQHTDDLGGLSYVLPEPVPAGKEDVYIDLKPAPSKPDDVWMAFKVPFLYRYTHFFDHRVDTLLMCDYASAGNRYSTDNLFRVWLPQPLYMHEIFPEQTWKILYHGEERPVFPERNTEIHTGNSRKR